MEKLTVTEIINKLDPDEVCQRLDVKPRSLRLARERGVFPASWYPVMRDICAARDVECPLSAFNWKSPDTPAQAEAS